MRRKYIYRALLFCCVFTSCVYDEEIITDDTPASGKFYMSLDLSIDREADAKTRTFGPDQADEAYERNISDVRVFFVKNDEASPDVIEIENISMMAGTTTTQPFEVAPEMKHGYLLYIVANTCGTRVFEPRTTSADDFIGEYALADNDCQKVWSVDNFVMTNVRNEIAEHDGNTPYGGIPVNLGDDGKIHDIDNPYTVKVALERLASKVAIDDSKADFDFSNYQGKFVSVKIDGVALVNCANKFKLIQEWDKGVLYKDSWEAVSGLRSSSGPLYGYPFLWCLSPSAGKDYNMQGGYYNRLSAFTDLENQCLKEGCENLFQAPGKPMYCLENNSPNYLDFLPDFDSSTDIASNEQRYVPALMTKMRGRTTGVLFRVRAKMQDDTHGNEDLDKDPDPGDWTAARNGVQTKRAADEYPTFFCYKNQTFSSVKAMLEANQELASKGIGEASSVRDLRNSGIQVFENGYMYYIYWIKDLNYEFAWTGKDDFEKHESFRYYAVLRNTFYDLKVSRVTQVGMDLPGREIDGDGNVIDGERFDKAPIDPIQESGSSNRGTRGHTRRFVMPVRQDPAD